jgi:AcrR family transcriptional regulator
MSPSQFNTDRTHPGRRTVTFSNDKNRVCFLGIGGDSMPKLGMQPIRQRQIIAAAIDTVHEFGFEHSSIRQIGLRAGISPSLITHYFGSRDELYAHVLRYLNRELARASMAGLHKARTPMERLMAIASAQLDIETIPTREGDNLVRSVGGAEWQS